MIDVKTFQRYAANPAEFRAALTVDVDGRAKRLGDVMDPWQRLDFSSLDPALLHCAGWSNEPPTKMRAYLERGRGHSKTTDLAVVSCWLLAFATRPLRGYAFAKDRDQSRLLLDAIERVIRLNPWLGQILQIQQNRVVNIGRKHPGAGGSLTIEASDVGSSYGILPDFIIGDEMCHWPESASALWESLVSSAAKRASCLFVVISNAGFIDSWQWRVRETIRTDANWLFSRLEGPQASWLTRNPERLEEQRRMLPPVAFARLWGNEWSTGGGDALTEADIDRAFKPELAPMPGCTAGYEYVAGLDLGVSRDASAICVLAVRKRNSWEKTREDHGRIRLAYTQLWRPTPGNKVELQQIETALRSLHYRYRFKAINYDPWAAQHMAQRLSLAMLPMQEVPPVGKQLQAQASALLEAFNDRRLDLYPDENLRRDLRRLRVEERAYGFRLVSPRDEYGHGDMARAFSLALLGASERAGVKTVLCTAVSGPNPTVMGYGRSQFEDERELRAWVDDQLRRHSEDPMLGRKGWESMIREQHPGFLPR